MKRIDKLHMKHPYAGSRMFCDMLNLDGYAVNRKRIQRLMRLMNIQPIYPKRSLSKPHPDHRIFPYLLRGVEIERPNHVWSTDITYLPLLSGYLYLVAIIDWYSRYVLSWELSNSLSNEFCITALNRALEKYGSPEIFNTDQGSQFTATNFTNLLLSHNIKVSMDGRGRALDNVFIERLWRTVKYEEVYLSDYTNGHDAYRSLKRYFCFYNTKRPHQSLGKLPPLRLYDH